MFEFQMFRIRVRPTNQLHLYQEDLTPQEIVKQTILSLPQVELRKGVTWRIGNVQLINGTGLYFRIGRTSKSTLEMFKDSNFVEQEFDTAPYTHVILDINLEVCAIAKKPKLSKTTIGIANQFAKLLKDSKKAQELQASFNIGDIKDPDDFISYLRSSQAITKYWMTFSNPNPWDANTDIVKPLQGWVQNSHAEKGKAEIEGENLDSVLLEELSRSIAATGDEAGAWLIPEFGNKRVCKRLRGNPAILSSDEFTEENHFIRLLNDLRRKYAIIRGSSEEDE